MPPPGHELLLRAICDDPDDTTLRLAYADWFDDNDDPARAEFVRVQCRLAGLGFGPLWPYGGAADPEAITRGLTGDAVALTRRQAVLWEANAAWLAECRVARLGGAVPPQVRGRGHGRAPRRAGAKRGQTVPGRARDESYLPRVHADAIEVADPAVVRRGSRADGVLADRAARRGQSRGGGSGPVRVLTRLRDLSLPGVG